MGPFDVDYGLLFLSVLKDWRVIAAALVILLSWALLRYVGLVFSTPMRTRLQPPKKMKKQTRPAKTETIEIEE
jgi:hypothetical protein